LIAAGTIGLLLLAACLVVASYEWFSADDFAFLSHVRLVPWSWSDVFLPVEKRFWWAYRPLGMESFYYAAYRLFGVEPWGYFAVVILVHFLTAPIVYGLGRQLGFDRRIAALAAVLAVSRRPSLTVLYYGAIFHYVAANLLYCASLWFFLEHGRRKARWPWPASILSLALALLCNEVSVTLPLLLVLASLFVDRFQITRASLVRAAGRTAPHFALAVLFLTVRFAIIEQRPAPRLYVAELGPNVITNYGDLLLLLYGRGWELGVVVSVAVIAGAGAVQARDSGGLGDLARVHALCLPWILGLLAPFVILPFPHPRFAMAAEVPACLLFASYLELLWRACAPAWRRALELSLLALLLALTPWSTFEDHVRRPRGAVPKAFEEVLDLDGPRLKSGSRVVVLFGAPGLADDASAAAFRTLVYEGSLVRAFFPDRHLEVRFQSVARGVERDILCPSCVHYALRADGRVEPIDRTAVSRLLAGGPSG
jgi:hypothetical protein